MSREQPSLATLWARVQDSHDTNVSVLLWKWHAANLVSLRPFWLCANIYWHLTRIERREALKTIPYPTTPHLLKHYEISTIRIPSRGRPAPPHALRHVPFLILFILSEREDPLTSFVMDHRPR